MIDWIIKNGIDFALVVVGASGIFVYIWQECRKKRDAASLIISQIDEFQTKLDEMSAYVVNGILNETAFYESFPIIETNYWAMYKHYFVRKMDAESYSRINKLYDYVSKIREQQLLMDHFQKRGFEMTHTVLTNIETKLITDNIELEESQFWNIYRTQQNKLKNIINQNALTPYIPVQIRLTFEKMLKKYSILEITGTDGYKMLKKISKRRK